MHSHVSKLGIFLIFILLNTQINCNSKSRNTNDEYNDLLNEIKAEILNNDDYSDGKSTPSQPPPGITTTE